MIDIPKDVTAATTLYEKYKPAKIIRSSEYIKEVDIQNAISMIREAKRPYILVGGGAVISDAADELKEFAEKVDAPVCDTSWEKEHLMVRMNAIVECLECTEQKHQILEYLTVTF